ncbi:MAG: glycosyltransferase [Proteobacteria bacterium]|nr:glycosyltransferase [Pseudomonadota bacterium]
MPLQRTPRTILNLFLKGPRRLILPAALWITAVPATAASAYLLLLTLLSARLPPRPSSERKLRFDVIVPAHNEHAVIANIIASLQQLDWPKDRYRIVVVADNCTDDTAAIATAAGAHVMQRVDQNERGKGYALKFAFAASRARQWADAVVVIDADAKASPNLLEAFAQRIEAGEQAVQAHYGVSNTDASWRTRLLSIAKASFHIVRSRARERLRLSCGIRGNGWCVTHALLEKVPYRAFSLTEDLEFGIELGMSGHRVAYADEAHADAEMVTGEKDARKQRQRWEQGRFQLVRQKTLPLLKRALLQHSAVCFDLALDLMVLPLSYVALNVAALVALAAVATTQGVSATWLWLGLGCGASLFLYTLRGWQLSGAGMRGLLDLARVPFFLIWKIAVMARGRHSKEWVRTNREGS